MACSSAVMGGGAGTVTLSVEEVANQNTTIRMKLRGQGFSNCQPFVRLSRTREVAGGALDKAPVFKTEVRGDWPDPLS